MYFIRWFCGWPLLCILFRIRFCRCALPKLIVFCSGFCVVRVVFVVPCFLSTAAVSVPVISFAWFLALVFIVLCALVPLHECDCFLFFFLFWIVSCRGLFGGCILLFYPAARTVSTCHIFTWLCLFLVFSPWLLHSFCSCALCCHNSFDLLFSHCCACSFFCESAHTCVCSVRCCVYVERAFVVCNRVCFMFRALLSVFTSSSSHRRRLCRVLSSRSCLLFGLAPVRNCYGCWFCSLSSVCFVPFWLWWLAFLFFHFLLLLLFDDPNFIRFVFASSS